MGFGGFASNNNNNWKNYVSCFIFHVLFLVGRTFGCHAATSNRHKNRELVNGQICLNPKQRLKKQRPTP